MENNRLISRDLQVLAAFFILLHFFSLVFFPNLFIQTISSMIILFVSVLFGFKGRSSWEEGEAYKNYITQIVLGGLGVILFIVGLLIHFTNA